MCLHPDIGGLIRSGLVVQLLLLSLARVLESSYCTAEQKTGCSEAVEGNALDKLPGGGECRANEYVHFTHICTVNKYVPSIEYCCCAVQQRVLCCRYHYDWNYFRCEADDTIETIADNSLPLLLTAILVPTAVALCCIGCCIRCICCRDDEDGSACSCSKCKCYKGSKKDTTSEKFTLGRSKRYAGVQRSTLTDSCTKTPISDNHQYDDHYKAMVSSSSSRNGAVPSVPSAPPLEDPAFAQLLSPSQRPSSTVGVSCTNTDISQSSNPGYVLHYVPLQPGHSTSNRVIECAYQEIRPQSPASNTYQVDPFTSTVNCCHVNPTQNQTLIGIITNQDGRPFLSDNASPPPRDPPPAYEDASSEFLKSAPEKETGTLDC